MNPRAFLDLSTRLMKDLKDWTEEVTARGAMSPDDLRVLQEAASAVERVTLAEAETAAPTER